VKKGEEGCKIDKREERKKRKRQSRDIKRSGKWLEKHLKLVYVHS